MEYAGTIDIVQMVMLDFIVVAMAKIANRNYGSICWVSFRPIFSVARSFNDTKTSRLLSLLVEDM